MPPKGINDVLEAIEIDRCIMGNRHTGKRRYRAHDKRSTAKRGGSVELIRPVAFDVHIRVALDRDKRHRFLPRIDTRKNHRITSEGISVSPRFPTLFRRVGAHDEAIKRIAWLNRFGRKRSFQLVVDIVLKLVVRGNSCTRRPQTPRRQPQEEAKASTTASTTNGHVCAAWAVGQSRE